MGNIGHEHLLRFAIHDTATQRLSEPAASKKDLQLTEPVMFRPTPQYKPLDRKDYQRKNGEFLPGYRGIENPVLPSIMVECEGLSGGGATANGTDASTLSSTWWDILEVLLGGTTESSTVQIDPSDSGTGTTLELNTGEGPVGVGRGIVVPLNSTQGSTRVVREVVGASSDTLTLDRAPTQEDGSADTGREGAQAAGMRTCFLDNDDHDRQHIAFFSEYEDTEYDYYGCFPGSAKLIMTHGEVLKLQLDGWSFTKAVETETPSGGSHSAPTSGDPIICSPVVMWVGGTQYIAYDLELDLGLNVKLRNDQGSSGIGHSGVKVLPAMPRLSGKFVTGSLTTPSEVTHDQRATWLGASKTASPTFDVAIQVGDVLGGLIYIRMPNFRFDPIDEVIEDGLIAYSFSGAATEPSSPATSPLTIHVG